MNALFIDARRTLYSVDQYCKTLTAGELIALLEQHDEDTPVFLRFDNGYTYGSISEHDLLDSSELEEES